MNYKNGAKRNVSARNRQAIAYWLVPARAEGELFQTIIKILAQELGAPLFEPHLTLFSTPTKGGSPARILRETSASPVTLRVRGIGFSARFTKTLFVRFEKKKALDQLAARLQRKSGASVGPVPDPHLSLFYREVSASTKKRLAAMIRLPMEEVVFDTLKAVQCAAPTRTPAQVNAWVVLGRKKLM